MDKDKDNLAPLFKTVEDYSPLKLAFRQEGHYVNCYMMDNDGYTGEPHEPTLLSCFNTVMLWDNEPWLYDDWKKMMRRAFTTTLKKAGRTPTRFEEKATPKSE